MWEPRCPTPLPQGGLGGGGVVHPASVSLVQAARTQGFYLDKDLPARLPTVPGPEGNEGPPEKAARTGPQGGGESQLSGAACPSSRKPEAALCPPAHLTASATQAIRPEAPGLPLASLPRAPRTRNSALWGLQSVHTPPPGRPLPLCCMGQEGRGEAERAVEGAQHPPWQMPPWVLLKEQGHFAVLDSGLPGLLEDSIAAHLDTQAGTPPPGCHCPWGLECATERKS